MQSKPIIAVSLSGRWYIDFHGRVTYFDSKHAAYKAYRAMQKW
jgi:hypothetical protein